MIVQMDFPCPHIEECASRENNKKSTIVLLKL